MVGWKKALEESPVKSAGYAYADIVHVDDQPQVEGVPGDIFEILITREHKGYSLQLTVLMEDLEEVSEDEITKRLKKLGANPNADWE